MRVPLTDGDFRPTFHPAGGSAPSGISISVALRVPSFLGQRASRYAVG